MRLQVIHALCGSLAVCKPSSAALVSTERWHLITSFLFRFPQKHHINLYFVTKRAFDTELVVMAEKLKVPLSEVGVIWNEIDGSKLHVGKLSLPIVSLGMLRDMVCVRACYFLRIWKLKS